MSPWMDTARLLIPKLVSLALSSDPLDQTHSQKTIKSFDIISQLDLVSMNEMM